jgi:hypothetical protein
MKLTLHEMPGRCRWCGCTDEWGCALGCSWANRAHTLCSACVDLDRLIRTQAGRQVLADAVSNEMALRCRRIGRSRVAPDAD